MYFVVQVVLRSRPVGYAAEYLTLAYVRPNMHITESIPMPYIIPYLVTYGLRLRTQIRKEVHPEGVRELCRRAEGEVHILAEDLRDVRARDLHAMRKLRLRHAQFLHPQQYPPQKRRSDTINRLYFHLDTASEN